MLTIFQLPPGFTASTTAVVGELITDLSPYLYLVLGVVLGVTVIEIIVHAIRPK